MSKYRVTLKEKNDSDSDSYNQFDEIVEAPTESLVIALAIVQAKSKRPGKDISYKSIRESK